VGLALAEMAIAGEMGFRVGRIADHAALFGEGPSRVLLCVMGQSLSKVEGRIRAADLGHVDLGSAGGDRLVVEHVVDVALEDAIGAWQEALPNALGLQPATGLRGNG
jgi:phosphoribosylformylglycinamidine synthase